MADFLSTIWKANNVTGQPNSRKTASSTEKNFQFAVNNAEQTTPSNTETTRPRKLVADRLTEQNQPERLIGRGGDVNIRPILLNSATRSDEMSQSQADARREAESFNTYFDSLTQRQQNIHGVFRFGDALASHANDPEWQAAFIETIGEERLATVIDQATDPTTYFRLNAGSQERANVDAITDALGNAYDAGGLTDESLSQLNSRWIDSNGGKFPPHIAELFANSSNPDLKAAFVDDALNKWRNNEGDSASVAAAASHVLGNSNTKPQIDTLIQLNESGELHRFIVNAAAGSGTQDTTFSHASNTDPSTFNYGGVTELINTVGTREYSGGTVTSLPADPKDVEAVAVTLFDAASDGLRDSAHLQNNVAFKNAFSNLVTTNFDQLVANSLENNGSIDHEFGKDFEIFSEHVLFGKPPSDNQAFAASFVSRKLNEYKAIAEGGDLSDRVAIGDTTRNRTAFARLTGSLLAHSLNGLEGSINNEKARAEDNAVARNFVVDVAFSLLPGPDAGKAVDAVFGTAKGLTKSEVKEALNAQDVDIDSAGFDTLYHIIRNDIGSDIPEQDAEELHDAFGIGFTTIRSVNNNGLTN